MAVRRKEQNVDAKTKSNLYKMRRGNYSSYLKRNLIAVLPSELVNGGK